MVQLLPSAWSATAAYSVNAVVDYNGIRFVCNTAVAANANGNAIPVGNSSWTFDAVLRITDYYSLQYAIESAINKDDDEINNSIPLYIQNTERKVGKLLRSPAQLYTATFTLDSMSRFSIPSDLLQIYHMRFPMEDAGYSLESRGNVSIQRAAERTDFEELKQYYNSNRYWNSDFTYDFPLYRVDNQHIYIAPDQEANTQVEMMYYQAVPELGATKTDNTRVLSNLWTANCPHLIKAGACWEASEYLKDDERAQMWKTQFTDLLKATQVEFDKFEAAGSQRITQESAYAYS